MAFSYNKKNLANTTITGAITPTQTSVTVADATVFSYAFFYATLMPSNEMSNASNSEIVLVTNIQGNTLTLVRGQENTIARSFPYGAVITNGIYTRDIDYARSIGRKVFMARDDGTDDTNTSYQIIDPMIKNVPEEGSIITVEFDTPSYGAPTLGVNNGIGGLVQVSGTDIHITDSSGQIESVEMYGDTEQTTYSGKNLLDLAGHLQSSSNGIVPTYSADGTLKLAGTATATWAYVTTEFAVNLPAGTYEFSIGGTLSHRIYIYFKLADDSTGYWIINAGSTTATMTFTQTVSTFRVELSAMTNGQTYNESITPMVESGRQATSFEPYVGGTASPNPDYPQEVKTVTGEQTITVSNGQGESQVYPINLGKNLLNEATMESGSFNYLNGGLFANATFIRSQQIPCEPNTTYSFSSNSNLGEFAVVYYASDKTTVVPGEGYLANYRTTLFTSPASAYYMRVKVGGSANPRTTDGDYDLQIEKGSTATSYAPYFTPIELCKIGTYQDYIYKSGEDWYVHKETGKVTFTGAETETWSSATAATGYVRFSTASGETHADNNGYCNELINRGSQSHGAYEYVWVQPAANAFYIQVLNTRANDLASFRTWLGTNPATVYYDISTPTDTKITYEPLIAQLEALYNMLPEGVADVVVTGDLPGSLTIKYYQQGTGTYTAPIVGGAEIDGGDNEQVVELDSYLPYRLVYDTNGYWRVLNKGPKVTTGAIADGAVTATKITRDNINYGTTSSDTRIGTFLGKPLWRRVEKFTNIPTGYSVHNWAAGTIANLDSIVAVNGMWIANGSTAYIPINSLPPDAVTTYGITIRDFTASSWAVVLGTGMSSGNSGYIILDYTKTS